MKAKQLIKLLKKEGWRQVRRKGSHRIFTHDKIKEPCLIVVPDHGSKDLGRCGIEKVVPDSFVKKNIKTY